MNSIYADLWHKKYHVIEVEIPAVKLLGVTIKKAWTKTVIYDCEMGQSCRERLVADMYRPNPLFQRIVNQAAATKG